MLPLFCERVFDSSCSHVSVVFCIFIFLIFKKDMTESHMQKCPRGVKCLTWVQHSKMKCMCFLG